ncbi:hypothetical protein [Paenibacillus xylanexedens]|uniref:hypothetical protein n=1 Tax=Paenibacillus xylanexedens TaxID=528191 RepID=UPI000F51EAA3|nr:hypothetical protein [Paenibacillus xylanexedens]
MPNCDWNMPCDCSNCREIIETHVCPSCQFLNKVSIDRIARWEDDRKGSGGYVFEVPTSPIKDLSCYSCGHYMAAVGYFMSVHERLCEKEKERADLIRAGKVCSSCNKIEGLDWGFRTHIQLQTFNGRKLCAECVVDAAKLEKTDPSDIANKYTFDVSKLEWILNRVKIGCATCSKSHWVNVAEKSWRKQCKTCYKSR